MDTARDTWLTGHQTRFINAWDQYFRGQINFAPATEDTLRKKQTLLLFGDPKSNPLIAKILKDLPITWTESQLTMAGKQFHPKTDIPMLIFPHPLHPTEYVVLNSGHTFSEADLKGTNAALFPRLGDYAVVKATGEAAYEVLFAGLFDEYWQFKK
jgi:hypothetical protein